MEKKLNQAHQNYSKVIFDEKLFLGYQHFAVIVVVVVEEENWWMVYNQIYAINLILGCSFMFVLRRLNDFKWIFV